MREIEFTVPSGFHGIRLKSFLRGYCKVSARLLAKLKKEPTGIMVNGHHAIATDTLQEGDHVCLNLPSDDVSVSPVKLPFDVVYEDEDILVVNKCSEMPMYPTPGHDKDSLFNAFSYNSKLHGEDFAYRPIYRLDKDTSGLVLLAKHSYAASRLAEDVKKTYFAICEGILSGSGLIDSPIGLKDGHKIQRMVRPDGLRAVTRWRSLYTGNEHSLIAFHLKTGRTHQIRVHMSDIGHPLAGDDFYGGSLLLIQRQALHCGEIRLVHPVSRRKLRFVQYLPEDMQNLLLFMQNCSANI
ncbi:MAG: Pseudouridine synthase [Oscillospiraceae bacterium]|jgi:23S rRNA pseudouridine1911/1915/1917 synthase